MDDQGYPQPDVDTSGSVGEADVVESVGEPEDLLDAPALPLFGLSFSTLTAIFVGGALGTLCRYLLESAHPAGTTGFPWITLGVNLSGSFAIGAVIAGTTGASRIVRPLVVVGFLGGWTTYSSLAVEAVLLGTHDRVPWALGYLAGTVVGGIFLVAAGHSLGRAVADR